MVSLVKEHLRITLSLLRFEFGVVFYIRREEEAGLMRLLLVANSFTEMLLTLLPLNVKFSDGTLRSDR